ncbi:hypothetical protein AAHN97_04550 [Chitinophaga niabensis]|uniref:hypothetical protein n=1 Tax=Chitinophaga niabensis TaxID=536979 RepID=UPI0031BB0485
MKQSDLLALLGSPVTDPGLTLFFEERRLSPPQSIPVMKPNSTTPLSIKNSVGIHDKEWGFSYYFRSELLNENFPVIKAGKNYIPYFSQIIFDGKLYQKRERKEPPGFWDASPSPEGDMETITNYFGKFDTNRKYPQQRTSYNSQVEIIVTLLSEESRINGYFAQIKETDELLHQSEFDLKKSNQVHLYAMLIKWLFDNRYLKVSNQSSSVELGYNTPEVLQFIQGSLNGHLWEDQLVADPQLHKFMLDSINGKADFEMKFYELWGKLDHYESLDWEAQKQWTAAISFNEETYAIFYAALNRSFEEYKKS